MVLNSFQLCRLSHASSVVAEIHWSTGICKFYFQKFQSKLKKCSFHSSEIHSPRSSLKRSPKRSSVKMSGLKWEARQWQNLARLQHQSARSRTMNTIWESWCQCMPVLDDTVLEYNNICAILILLKKPKKCFRGWSFDLSCTCRKMVNYENKWKSTTSIFFSCYIILSC